MGWATSNRAERLPTNWADIRRQVKARADNRCEADQHAPRCNGTGTDADHITPGDNHTLDNLQWLSEPCHRAKTAHETRERNRNNAALKRRPTERHPGRRTP